MKKNNTISLCIIALNEEDCILTCLESAKHLVDEIILIDTGSTDQTVSLAQQAGARIFPFPWQNDFALVRNFSLLHATGDWILVLDGDEILEPCTREQFDELLVPEIEGYFLPIRNLLQEKNQSAIDYVVRLFRHRPQYQFEGALHEQIVPSILRSGGGKSLAHAPLVIDHYGYLSPRLSEKRKSERNRCILKQELTKDPNNPFYLYCLGLEYLQQNELESGISSLEAARVRLSPEEGYYSDLLQSLALSYLKLQKLPEFFSILDQWPNVNKSDQLYPILSGLGHLLQNEPLQAIQHLNQALAIEDTSSEHFTRSQIYSLLGDCYYLVDNPQEAVTAYLEALKASPWALYPFLQILALLRKTTTIAELLEKESLLSQISGFAPPHFQRKMAARLAEQESLSLALLLDLCALYQTLSVEFLAPSSGSAPTPLSFNITDCCQDILRNSDNLPSQKQSTLPSKFLSLKSHELAIYAQFIRQFPQEQNQLTKRLIPLILELFTLITFHFLPAIDPPNPALALKEVIQ